LSRSAALTANVRIRNELKAGDIGFLTYLHGKLYAEEQGWDSRVEAYVAGAFSDFVRSRSPRDRIWIVEEHDETRGSVAIIEAPDNKAQLRCFLLHPDLRGRGIGKTLVEDAVDFCRASSYSAVYLWTVSTLVAAARIYRPAGFQKTEEPTQELWEATVRAALRVEVGSPRLISLRRNQERLRTDEDRSPAPKG